MVACPRRAPASPLTDRRTSRERWPRTWWQRSRTICRRRSAPRPAGRCSTGPAARSAARGHETVDIAVAALPPFSGPPQASLLGRRERMDIAARRADQRHQLARARLRRHPPEDRHPPGRAGGVGHPGARGDAARCRAASSCTRSCSAPKSSAASATPCIPAHYDRGWHITGTTGVFGAAAASGRLLGLVGAADALGARPRRDAAGRAARDVRHHDQELSSRAAPRRTA